MIVTKSATGSWVSGYTWHAQNVVNRPIHHNKVLVLLLMESVRRCETGNGLDMNRWSIGFHRTGFKKQWNKTCERWTRVKNRGGRERERERLCLIALIEMSRACHAFSLFIHTLLVFTFKPMEQDHQSIKNKKKRKILKNKNIEKMSWPFTFYIVGLFWLLLRHEQKYENETHLFSSRLSSIWQDNNNNPEPTKLNDKLSFSLSRPFSRVKLNRCHIIKTGERKDINESGHKLINQITKVWIDLIVDLWNETEPIGFKCPESVCKRETVLNCDTSLIF